jgi:predicted nuclease of predicted toxin-antitoxin system
MRILCDQMVEERYVSALRDEEQHIVSRVRTELAPNADDDAIADYATRNDWVILTSDDDFFREEINHGLLYFNQVGKPTPRELCEAISKIDRAYDDHAMILESIPSEWV